MQAQAFLGGAHIWRRHDQRVGSAIGRRAPGQGDGPGGARQAGTGKYRHRAAEDGNGAAQQAVILFIGQGGRFTGRTGHDYALDAGFELQGQQPLPGIGIECTVGLERCRQGGDKAGNGQGDRRSSWG
ncbi:hypothetical protein D3C71_1599670 [compost metagenome]